VAKGFTDRADFEIYDSLHYENPSIHLLNTISKPLNCKASFTYLIKKPTKENAVYYNFGVYAFAFVTALCFGEEFD
jgi:hypothetical protein